MTHFSLEHSSDRSGERSRDGAGGGRTTKAFGATIRRWISLALAFALLAPFPAAAKPVAAIVNAYSDDQLIDGFVRTVFGAEAPSQQRMRNLGRVKKFGGRIRVHVINLADEDRRAEVMRFLKVLSVSVKNLSMTPTKSKHRAQMIVFLVNRRDYKSVIDETLAGMPAASKSSLLKRSACSAVTGGRNGVRLDRSFVYIVADEGRSTFRHCMVEEITQSLGPVNDDWHLSASIYNDSSRVNSFGIFDWYILNMLYDHRVKAGMTPTEVRKVLPAAIADARKRLSRLLTSKRINLTN